MPVEDGDQAGGSGEPGRCAAVAEPSYERRRWHFEDLFIRWANLVGLAQAPPRGRLRDRLVVSPIQSLLQETRTLLEESRHGEPEPAPHCRLGDSGSDHAI